MRAFWAFLIAAKLNRPCGFEIRSTRCGSDFRCRRRRIVAVVVDDDDFVVAVSRLLQRIDAAARISRPLRVGMMMLTFGPSSGNSTAKMPMLAFCARSGPRQRVDAAPLQRILHGRRPASKLPGFAAPDAAVEPGSTRQ